MPTNDRRLIEDFIPIREISAEASREKSIRKGHISTLHLWWARRPLVAARAAVYAALVPAPQTPEERNQYEHEMIALCKWQVSDEALERARERILAANGGIPPKVLDMFAGGGAIPLEALRLGCEAYAVDLNPVAHLIELCTLVYPQQYGERLAEEVERWGKWVLERVRAEIGDLYPPIPAHYAQRAVAGDTTVGEEEEDVLAKADHLRQRATSARAEQRDMFSSTPTVTATTDTLMPVAYLWTRTVRCPNPACEGIVPLVRQTWLAKKSNYFVALKMVANQSWKGQDRQVRFEVVTAATEEHLGFDPAGFSDRGNALCPFCGSTVGIDYVKSEGRSERMSMQAMAIVCTRRGRQGKVYISADDLDSAFLPSPESIRLRIERLCAETGLSVPTESLPAKGTLGFRVQAYGMKTWGSLFTDRQLLALLTFCKWVNRVYEKIEDSQSQEQKVILTTYLGMMVSRLSDFCSAFCTWNYTGGRGTKNTFARQALPMVWDFAETNPFNETGANWEACINAATSTIPNLAENRAAKVMRASATKLSFQPDTFDAVVTDPPYYDNVPYADLSDYFYVWLKRAIGHLHSDHFSNDLTPKKQEAIAEPARFGGDVKKARTQYERMMQQAFEEAHRVLKPQKPLICVYAHKTTVGWATLVEALRQSGYELTEAWPLDTERPGRVRDQNSAALATSLFIVARKRDGAPIGNYVRDVRPQLQAIVKERVTTLRSLGISGADLVIACVGAGLRAYTQYARVELPNGDELDASSFLDEVQRAVLEVILADVMGVEEAGVSVVDKISQYYVLARYQYGTAAVDFDEANVLARGVGVELDGPRALTSGSNSLVKKTKTTIEWRDYRARGADERLGVSDGQEVPLVDVLQRLLWLNDNQPVGIPKFLMEARPDVARLKLVAEALGGKGLAAEPTPGAARDERTEEQKAIGRLLPAWRRVVEEQVQGRLL